MGEQYLTMADIEKLYPNEWVLIDRPTSDRRTGRVSGGHVVMHTRSRDEFDRRLIDNNEFPQVVRCAIFYVGSSELEPSEVASPTA
jgi:hypothetical protein